MSEIHSGKTERSRYWSELMTAWSQSGLSQAEFCRQRGVKLITFGWWKRRLQQVGGPVPAGSVARDEWSKRRGWPPKAASPRFVEVRLPEVSALPAYEVVLMHGRSIRVPSRFDPQALVRLIAAVESC
jgi:hypothetical protein